MGFRLVPKSVTLNDIVRRNGHYVAFFFIDPERMKGGVGLVG